jgi:hypothetical protein
MAELLPFAKEWGWTVAIVLYAASKLIPAFVDRYMPDLMTARNEEKKAARDSVASDRAELLRAYDRMVAMQDKTLNFVASCSSAIQSMQRSMDGNTQELFRVREAVERGPECPLQNCPFMGKNEDEP